MSRVGLLQQMLVSVLVALLLAGCGGARAVPTETPVPPTAVPTSTPVSPAVTPEAQSWDYVELGGSVLCTFGSRYAEHIEADLGVEVTVHAWCRTSHTSTELLRLLRDSQQLRSDIHGAEVVTFPVSVRYLKYPIQAYGDGTCGGPDNQDCLREALTLYKKDVDAIIAEMLSLRSTSDTIIRGVTYYNWLVDDWKKEGYFDDLNPYWVTCNEYFVQAASEHNIPVARVDLAFNGPALDEDPSDKGYLLGDKHHPNQQGRALMAELVRELGYEPLAP
jgi:hypothetical protein